MIRKRWACLVNARNLLMTAVVACVAVAMPPSAQAAEMTHGEIFGQWMANCPVMPNGKAAPCRLVQVEQRQAKNGQKVKLLRATILPVTKEKRVLLVLLPLGYSIPPGVILSVDGNTKGYKMIPQRCVPQGCELAISMGKDVTAELKKGKVAKINFLMGNKKAHFEIPLSGLTKGLSKL